MHHSGCTGVGNNRNSRDYAEALPRHLGAWMAGFDSHFGDCRPARRAGSSRPLGCGSLVRTRSRLSSHFCCCSHRLPSPCSLLLDSCPVCLQNVTRRILFFFLHRNYRQHSASSLFPKGFFPPRGGMATCEHVFLCCRPIRLGGRLVETVARGKPSSRLFLGCRVSAAFSPD